MNVIYEPSVLDQIKDVITVSDCTGKKIHRIEVTTKEMVGLLSELGSGYSYVHFFWPRSVMIHGVKVVEVSDAK